VTDTGSSPGVDEVLSALRRSRDRLADELAPLTDVQVGGPSYADDWTVAQVVSHLGSGAEVFGLFLDAGVRGDSAPGVEQFQPIWGRWDAKPAAAQVRDGVSADAAFLDRLDRLGPDERDAWRLDLFGSEQTLSALLRMRLAEHALHTWDIAVALDPSVTLSPDAAGLVVHNLPMLVERVGKPVADPVTVNVRTSAPARFHRLDVTRDEVRLACDVHVSDTNASLELPAEAFVRLVYGRLDPDRTPLTVHTHGFDLDTLRRAFPGV
jgi:uncharacterized protein (TIGR03083 family)